MHVRLALFFIFIVTLVSGCGASGPTSTPAVSPIIPPVSPIATPQSVPAIRSTPLPDKTSITGKIVSTGGLTQQPLAKTIVRLARVYWNSDKTDGAVVLDGASSPSSITNDTGEFYFDNVEAVDYAVVVGDAEVKSVIVSQPDGSARVVTGVSGKIVEVGVLEVPYAP